ncbi:MAG: hypothetical protein Q9226_003171 [Calogaya cf. arnoldii]
MSGARPPPQREPPSKVEFSHKFVLANTRNIGGDGCFNAGVFVVKRKSTGETMVEKRYKVQEIRFGTAAFEMHVLRKYKHPDIVEYMAAFIDEKTHREPVASLYMEHCDRGNVEDLTKEYAARRTPLPERVIWHIFMQLVNAVAFLQYGIEDACFHPQPPNPNWVAVLHRDIKPDNVFLCSRPNGRLPRVVLGDFGQGYKLNDNGRWQVISQASVSSYDDDALLGVATQLSPI